MGERDLQGGGGDEGGGKERKEYLVRESRRSLYMREMVNGQM